MLSKLFFEGILFWCASELTLQSMYLFWRRRKLLPRFDRKASVLDGRFLRVGERDLVWMRLVSHQVSRNKQSNLQQYRPSSMIALILSFQRCPPEEIWCTVSRVQNLVLIGSKISMCQQLFSEYKCFHIGNAATFEPVNYSNLIRVDICSQAELGN